MGSIMKTCAHCGRDLSNQANVTNIECQQAAHDGSMLDIVLTCRCGTQYNDFVPLSRFVLVED